MSDKMNHLSPFDLTGVGYGFGLYRPRRPSYTFATQAQRQRSESYRYAVRKEINVADDPADFIEGIIQRKNRKDSYIRATRDSAHLDVELNEVRQAMKALDEDMAGESAGSPTEPSAASNFATAQLPNTSPAGNLRLNASAVSGKEYTSPLKISPSNQSGSEAKIASYQPPSSPVILINDQGIPDNYDTNHMQIGESYDKANGTKRKNRMSIPNELPANHLQELKEVVEKKRYSPNCTPLKVADSSVQKQRKTGLGISLSDTKDEYTDDSVFEPDYPESGVKSNATPTSSDGPPFPGFTKITFRKNLVLLCVSFILIYTAFRAIQNLQSSINAQNYLGIISMACVHGTMFITCLWAPVIINQVTAKWTLVVGMSTYIVWIAANFYPRFYTLIPTGILVGIGKGILWTAESSYILKLSFDYSRLTREGLEKEMFRFHGVFLACFQTTHIFGNLISSLILQNARTSLESKQKATVYPDYLDSNMSMYGMSGDEEIDSGASCGVLFSCKSSSTEPDLTEEVPSSLWKLMSAYIILGCIAFSITVLCLDKIGAKFEPEKTGYEIVVEHVQLMIGHKVFRLLIPLLIFSGLQQAFVFSDFNQAYVTCTIGEEYVGYSMIVLGFANVVSAILVAVCARIIPREVVFGVGGIIHMGLMIGLLIWIPDKRLLIFFVMAASWGLCDAVWQTQCNTLICITCPENAETAFANYRLLQSFGLTVGFISGTFLCVSFKLYILMILLVVAIMFYVLAEYKVRQVDVEVFEGSIEVN